MLRPMGGLLVLALVVGCSASGFKATPASKASPASSSDGIVTPASSEIYKTESKEPIVVSSPEETPVVPLPDVAVIPVPIGGAPLTCVRSPNAPESVKCEILNDIAGTMAVNPSVAYMITGKDAQKTKVTLNSVAVGSFTFTIPTLLQPLKTFGVSVGVASGNGAGGLGGYGGFASNGQDVLVAMVGYGTSDLTNAVLDPSFENLAIPSNDHVLYVEQGNFKSWMGRSKADTGCLDLSPVIKIQSAFGDALAFDGKQWTDLDSGCAEDYTKAAGNIGLFQDLAVKKDHVYAISFAQKRNPDASSAQKIIVKFGQEVLIEHETVDKDWTVLRTLRAATDDTMRLDFEEVGLSDGKGTLLDDVRVYDLGLPESP